MFHIHSNRSLISSLLATTFLFAGAGSAAHAQQTPPPIPSAPVFPNVDENGVDLTTAKFEYAITGVTIGEGDAALDAAFRTANGQWRADSFKGYVRASYGSPLITVTLNGDSETFTTTGWPGGTITSNQAEGSTLIYDSWAKLYYYTKTDGTVAVFDVTKYANGIGNGSQVSASLVSLQHPNGKKETIDYRIVVGTAATPAGTLSGTVVSAVDSIKNNYGYQIKYNYPPNGGGPNPSFGLLSVTAINNGKDYCNPSANSCSVTQTAATSSVTQTYVNAAPVITNLTDPLGRLTQFTYNAAGQLTGIKRPGSAGNNVSIVYNGSGNVQSVTNEGIVFQYNYSVNAGVATMTRTNPSGQTLVVVTNQALGRPSSVKDEASRTTTYLYDTNGRVTRMTLPEGNYVQYAYDGRGNVTSSTRVAKSGSGLANIVVSASYPASCTNAKTCNKPTTSTDALGNITDYAYDAGSGFVTSVTAPAPVTGGVRPQTRYTYVSPQAYFKNSSGSIVASGQPITLLQTISQCRSTTSCAGGADETKTSIYYGPQAPGTANNLLAGSVTTAAGDASLSATSSFSYDDSGNRIIVDGPLAGSGDTSRYRFDLARQLTGVVAPDPDGAGGRIHAATRYTYNSDGQTTQVDVGTVNSQTDADWAAMSVAQSNVTTYDVNARPVKKELKSAGTTYAVNQTSYDTLGRVDCTVVRMDPAQWASQTNACVPQTTNANFGPDRVTKTSYTAASEVSQIQTAFGTTEQSTDVAYTYSANGKRVTATDAENNLTTYVLDGHDRLSQVRYPASTKGANASNSSDYDQFSYDANGNVTQKRLRDGAVINLSYDKLNRVTGKDTPNNVHFDYDITYQYDLQGRLKYASTSPGHTNSFTYDALGRMTAQLMYNTATYSNYDAAGRRTRLTWADGSYVDYDYDFIGKVTAVRENGAMSGSGVLATYAYDNLGRRSNITRGNGTTTNYSFDSVSRIIGFTQDIAGTLHDGLWGQVFGANSSFGYNASSGTPFAYNPAGQLIESVRYNDAYAWSNHYNVDRVSNSNGLNQLTNTGATNLGYDLRGNLSSSGSYSYGYTSENRMATTSSAIYLGYEPSGNQVLQLYSSGTGVDTRFGWDGDRISMEISGNSGAILRRYVPGAVVDETLVWYEGTGLSDRRWLHSDERGSVVAVTDSSGNAIAINRYDEYGIPAAMNIGRFQYTGQAWLPELGMYYYKARIYSPTLGRFMQTDPIGYSDGMNWYNYVRSDPVNKVDPTGLSCELVGCDGENGGIVATGPGTYNPGNDYNSNNFVNINLPELNYGNSSVPIEALATTFNQYQMGKAAETKGSKKKQKEAMQKACGLLAGGYGGEAAGTATGAATAKVVKVAARAYALNRSVVGAELGAEVGLAAGPYGAAAGFVLGGAAGYFAGDYLEELICN